MTIEKFLEGDAVQLSDLFGPWKCKGFRDTDENASEKITKKLAFMRCHFGKLLKKSPMPEAASCKFKRGDVNGKGDGEWMLVLDSSDTPLALFSASIEGFVQRPLQGTTRVAAPEHKHKTDGDVAYEHETRTPKEIQAAIPLELRKTWVNYDLLDRINEELMREYGDEVLPAGLEQ